MKPLKLKIKGINSFIEQQEIDFERLTEYKFFGIFGPTGSGKSTILDGITLALYGQVSRKSDNYINANVTSANVSYEFQISGAIDKRYRVEREFKLDKTTNRPRGGKCKIVAMKESGDEIISEGVKEVTAKCIEIIGLSCDDFTRTVVLPQGKFSEFLTLKGTDRNNMLERLFNLEQYGEQLTAKLKKRGEKEEVKDRELQGQLNAYGEVDEEVCKARESELESVNQQTKSIEEAYTKAEQTFKKFEEVWNLQEELKGYNIEAERIEKQKFDIDKERKLVESSKKAAGMIHFVEEWKNGKKDLKDAEDKLGECQEEFEKLRKEKNDSEVKYEELQTKREVGLPVLQKREEKAKEASKRYREAEALKKDIEKISEEKDKVEIEISNSESTQKIFLEQLEDKKKNRTDKEAKKVEFRVEAEFKSKVQEGASVESEFYIIKNQKEALETKIENKEKEKQALKSDKTKTDELWKTKKDELVKEEDRLAKLKNNPPISTESLQAMYERKLRFTKDWENYNQISRAKEESENIVKAVDKLLRGATEKELEIKKECEVLEEERLASETEHLASELRKGLVEGEVCPVCGSLEHHQENIKVNDDLAEKDFEKLLKSKKKEYERISKSISDLEAKRSINEKSIEDKIQLINKLGHDFLQVDIKELDEEYNRKKADIDRYNKQLSEKEEVLKKLNSESELLYNKLIKEETEFTAIENALKEDIGERTEALLKLNKSESKYFKLKADTTVENFDKAMKEITSKEKEREVLEDDIQKLSEEIKELEKKRETMAQGLVSKREKHALLKNDFEHMDKKFKEIWEDITEKVGGEKDINGYKEKLRKEIQELEDAFQIAKERKRNTENEFVKIQKHYEHIKGQKSVFERSLEERISVMEQKVKEFGFNDHEEAEKAIIPVKAMDTKNTRIKDFDEKSVENAANMKKVREKLGNHSVSKEERQNIKKELEHLKTMQNELNKRKIGLEFEVQDINTKLLKIKEIKGNKKIIEYTVSMLKELEKLFKGKKFVQFVAAERLKVVSLIASKTLMEISSGSYELATNNEGEFVIKDYKNGGIERETSTLSGGELFLASLALALALSTQIQLKNDAPLELFFLDEGFGTLDDNLLEEVISSLEKLQDSKRAIGLISHVTEIKNRVPVKLMITPAQLGKQGSKVNIELS